MKKFIEVMFFIVLGYATLRVAIFLVVVAIELISRHWG